MECKGKLERAALPYVTDSNQHSAQPTLSLLTGSECQKSLEGFRNLRLFQALCSLVYTVPTWQGRSQPRTSISLELQRNVTYLWDILLHNEHLFAVRRQTAWTGRFALISSTEHSKDQRFNCEFSLN